MSVLFELPKAKRPLPRLRRYVPFASGVLVGVLVPLLFLQRGGSALTLLALVVEGLGLLFALRLRRDALDKRSLAAVEEAERLVGADDTSAWTHAAEALRCGSTDPNVELRAWVVVGRVLETRGEFGDASEAMARALLVGGSRAAVAYVLAMRAFFDACRGALDEAEANLARVATDTMSLSCATELARARTMVHYRRGRFRETVDTAAEAKAKGFASRARDAAFFEAIAQSARLRLDTVATGGHPMRIAASTELEAWLDFIDEPMGAEKKKVLP